MNGKRLVIDASVALKRRLRDEEATRQADVGQRGTAWNDTDEVRPDYAVIYEGHPGIIPSKRWEDWREGVQDFALVSAALANARTETERKAVKTLAAEGRQALGDSAKFVKIRRKLFELARAPGTGDLPKYRLGADAPSEQPTIRAVRGHIVYNAGRLCQPYT